MNLTLGQRFLGMSTRINENQKHSFSVFIFNSPIFVHRFFYLHNLKKMSALSITVSVYSREVPVPVQREYRFCQFSKEGTDMDIHRVLLALFSSLDGEIGVKSQDTDKNNKQNCRC